MNDIDALLELEQRRCAAISSADRQALQETLSNEYVHIHAVGNIDDRDGFIAGILSNPRIVERGNITVRVYGDAAILIGEQTNRREGNDMVGILQQVAVKRDEVWRFVSAQMTRKS